MRAAKQKAKQSKANRQIDVFRQGGVGIGKRMKRRTKEKKIFFQDAYKDSNDKIAAREGMRSAVCVLSLLL